MWDEEKVKDMYVQGNIGITIGYDVIIQEPTLLSEIYNNYFDFIDFEIGSELIGIQNNDAVLGSSLDDFDI